MRRTMELVALFDSDTLQASASTFQFGKPPEPTW